MLGNITLVYPIEKLYNNTFQKQWDRALDRIRLISPGDLEEMDEQVRKLERYYELSGVKKLSVSLGTYPDDYANKIKTLRSNLCDTIGRKFRLVAKQVSDLAGDPESISEFEKDRKKFDESLALFRMLRAFYSRWKLNTDQYVYPGERFDFTYELNNLAFRLAKKRMVLMNEYTSMKKTVDYKEKTAVLDEISGEVSKLFDWYSTNYLNTDAKNALWIGSDQLDDSTPWMPVDFLDDDPSVAPLERFRKVPTEHEMDDVNRLFEHFVQFYRRHELVGLGEVGILSDYVKFRDYAANFSLYSDDAEERLKAALMEQMLKLHKVIRDAKERINLKAHTEKLLGNSFAMYFAPIDEVYNILTNGFISSDDSVHHKYSTGHYDNLIFSVDSDIKDGDIGFIFPLTKVINGHRFYQVSHNPLVKEGLSESNTQLHVFSHGKDKPLKIDIRLGVFIAPKNKTVRYTVNGTVVKETSEQYFRRFFEALSHCGSGWFECDRLQSWMSRHCIFYDDETRVELLNMLRNKSFVSIINQFTNNRYDNLALAQIEGELEPTDYYVTHKFDSMPQETKDLLKSETFNLTLFEWQRKEG